MNDEFAGINNHLQVQCQMTISAWYDGKIVLPCLAWM